MSYQSTRQLQSDLSTLISKIRDISSNESNTTDQVATLLRETVEQHVKKIEENVSTLAHHVQNLRATERELREVSHTVALLAGKPVDEALQDVLNKMVSNTKPTKLDFDKFDQAARKELGMKL